MYKLYHVFNEVSEGKGGIDNRQFQEALKRLEEYGLQRFSSLPLGHRLFALFDKNNDGVVDLKEFMLGTRSFSCERLDWIGC